VRLLQMKAKTAVLLLELVELVLRLAVAVEIL
jgi:hypothetical protein